MRRLTSVLVALGCCWLSACSGDAGPSRARPNRVGSTRGAAVVLSQDERIAVAANRTAGVVTVFQLDPSQGPEHLVSGAREIDVGVDAEPWSVVLGADDDTAYVVLRGQHKLLRIGSLFENPTITGDLALGSEPTAIAISPSGERLFVANFGEGSVSMVTTRDFVVRVKPDLNLELAKTGALGPLLGPQQGAASAVWSDAELQSARPGLAHPRALALSDDGDEDDDDETLYITEFFSQPLETKSTPDHSEVDRNRQGLVYRFNLQGYFDSPLRIAPVPDTGLADSTGARTACFPNQLSAAVVSGDRLYVTSVCTSPRGPLGEGNFGALLAPTLFSLDLTQGQQATLETVVLPRWLRDAYDGDSTLADKRRLPLVPSDLVAAPAEGASSTSLFLTAFGSDAVFRVDFDSARAPLGVGDAGARFIDLHALTYGRLPDGIALSKRKSKPFALVLNDATNNLSVFDVASNQVAAQVPSAGDWACAGRSSGACQKVDLASRLDPHVTNGRRLFATGLGAWSNHGLAESSCESCHPDGQSDGVTWYFARGPRRTISTAGTYFRDDPTRRALLWTANIDEVQDIEAIVRGVSGGVGAVVWNDYGTAPSVDCRLIYDGSQPPAPSGGQPLCPAPKHTSQRINGLNGSLASAHTGASCDASAELCDVNASSDWGDIDAFLRSVRAPLKPTTLPTDVSSGEALFRSAKCGACHSGPGFTLAKLFYQPGAENNGAVPYDRASASFGSALLGKLRTARYTLPSALAGLNPPAASGSATFRSFEPKDTSDVEGLNYVYGTSDQLNCVLRDVGTFPVQPPNADNIVSVVAPGAPSVFELKADMQSLGLGKSGFNIPSLLGLGTSGAYFHAGNARTLEELFDPAFSAHYRAMGVDVLGDALTDQRAERVRALVQYLLSLDEDTAPQAPSGLDFNPDLCAQFAE